MFCLCIIFENEVFCQDTIFFKKNRTRYKVVLKIDSVNQDQVYFQYQDYKVFPGMFKTAEVRSIHYASGEVKNFQKRSILEERKYGIGICLSDALLRRIHLSFSYWATSTIQLSFPLSVSVIGKPRDRYTLLFRDAKGKTEAELFSNAIHLSGSKWYSGSPRNGNFDFFEWYGNSFFTGVEMNWVPWRNKRFSPFLKTSLLGGMFLVQEEFYSYDPLLNQSESSYKSKTAYMWAFMTGPGFRISPSNWFDVQISLQFGKRFFYEPHSFGGVGISVRPSINLNLYLFKK